MTSERIAEIKALCEAATPGIWRVALRIDDEYSEVSAGDKMITYGALINDTEFIAAARQIIPELLEEIGRLKIQLEHTRRLYDIEKSAKQNIIFNLECVLKERETNGKTNNLFNADGTGDTCGAEDADEAGY